MIDKITEKQQKIINNIEDYGEYNPPKFKGKTKKEASDYIEKYKNCLVSDVSLKY